MVSSGVVGSAFHVVPGHRAMRRPDFSVGWPDLYPPRSQRRSRIWISGPAELVAASGGRWFARGFSVLDSALPRETNHSMIFSRRNFLVMVATIVVTVAILLVVACGVPTYQNPPISIAFSTSFPPPAGLATSATVGIAAVVSNDLKNEGVQFTCAPAQQCGSFSPDPIASNVPTSYQAPSAVPAGGSVTVTATSVSDGTKFVSAKITID